MKTKLQLIDDLLKPYIDNPKSRAVITISSGTSCSYLTKDGRKCLVGQCMLPGPWQKSVASASGLFSLFKEEDVFREEYRGHSVNFWSEMQYFHDHNGFWNYSGLTETGKLRLESIKQKYKDQ